MLMARLVKVNRRRRGIILRKTDENGRKITLVVRYDDLKKAKKPPAWMQELLFDENTEKAS